MNVGRRSGLSPRGNWGLLDCVLADALRIGESNSIPSALLPDAPGAGEEKHATAQGE